MFYIQEKFVEQNVKVNSVFTVHLFETMLYSVTQFGPHTHGNPSASAFYGLGL